VSPEIKDKVMSHIKASSNPSLASLAVLHLTPETQGSADALREVKKSGKVPSGRNILLLPADLVLEDPVSITQLCNIHTETSSRALSQSSTSTSCLAASLSEDKRFVAGSGSVTMLLADVGVEDEEGVPIKESKKGKMGQLQRETDDVEIFATTQLTHNGVATSMNDTFSTRVLIKQSKVEIDEEEENVGETPKLVIPKHIIRTACSSTTTLSVRTDLLDLHAYAISPWVWDDYLADPSSEGLVNIQTDVLQTLIAKQEAGYSKVFNTSTPEFDEAKAADLCVGTTGESNFEVNAYILPRSADLTLRICSLPNYLFACREAVTHAIRPTSNKPNVYGRLNGTVHAKDSSLLGEGVQKGSGGAIKNTTIGARVTIGNKVKINNCVIFDDVVIGDGCILQNSIVCKGAKLEDSCNLNDCQVDYDAVVAAGTKVKGETIEKD
jgi:hypothetical protein